MRYCGFFLLLLLTACTLGPDFVRPKAPIATHYVDERLQQQFDVQKIIPIQWWKIYQSPALNRFMSKALRASPDLKSAEANLKIAHENVRAHQLYYLPYANASFNPTRQLTAGTLQSNLASNEYLYSLETALVSVTYMPDVWGMQYRKLESLKAQREAAFYQKRAIYLTLASNLVLAVIQEASLREQREVTIKMIDVVKRRLAMIKQEQSIGQIGVLPVVAEQNLLAQLELNLAVLEKQWQSKRHLLHAMAGRLPGEHLELNWTLASFHLPKKLPLKLPSALVQQRPDIQAAIAQLHSASAEVGVATANRFPSLILSSYTGSAPLNFGTLFAGGTGFWGAGMNFLGPLFDWGALKHKQKGAVAYYQFACEQYRKVILVAFKNVADTLTALESDDAALNYARDQKRATEKTKSIARQSFEYGKTGYLNVLFAEQSDKEATLNVIQAEANRLGDTVALFQALGGGWKS